MQIPGDLLAGDKLTIGFAEIIQNFVSHRNAPYTGNVWFTIFPYYNQL